MAIATLAAILVTATSAQAASPAIERYQGSWVHRALGLQYELGGDVGFVDAPWVGTHNSFNSVAEMGPTLSNQDSNQKLSLVDQLRIDVRSLELDLHWFPSARDEGYAPVYAPVVCHATGEHAGCSVEKPLGPVLGEIGRWLRRPAHGDQVLLLYLEDHLDEEKGYDEAAGIIRERLGDLLYEPRGEGCTTLPDDLTRDQVRAAGAQVVAVSSCGIGAGWPSVIFDWSAHREARPMGYTGFPRCGPDFSRADYDERLIRYFEDSTQLTNTAGNPDDGITPATAAAMARCGVDLVGLDQLGPYDGRLASLVWSWAPAQPRAGAGRCALQRVNARWPFGRWFASGCGRPRQAACLSEA
ncbi:MAG TPA: hypothetical protein VGR10_05165, partial [Thermoleophilaceae bacterium]|nr:hypothetical protein [Thermoleophilaceae bacterium]